MTSWRRKAPEVLTQTASRAYRASMALEHASVPGEHVEAYALAKQLLRELADIPDDVRAELAIAYERSTADHFASVFAAVDAEEG